MEKFKHMPFKVLIPGIYLINRIIFIKNEIKKTFNDIKFWLIFVFLNWII